MPEFIRASDVTAEIHAKPWRIDAFGEAWLRIEEPIEADDSSSEQGDDQDVIDRVAAAVWQAARNRAFALGDIDIGPFCVEPFEGNIDD